MVDDDDDNGGHCFHCRMLHVHRSLDVKVQWEMKRLEEVVVAVVEVVDASESRLMIDEKRVHVAILIQMEFQFVDDDWLVEMCMSEQTKTMFVDDVVKQQLVFQGWNVGDQLADKYVEIEVVES